MHTLRRILDCGLERSEFEIVVVDNVSQNGTPEAAAAIADRVVRLDRNAGSCAKAYGVDYCRGRYIVFLDDDSHPAPGSISRMIAYFEADARLAAAGFTVCLPDGTHEGAALPGVFVGCGVGLRADALKAVGGLDRSFFMQAEEYDLAFKLVAAGWEVAVFDDLRVEHQKTLQARRPKRTTYLDARNNLRVVARYLPASYARIYRDDLIQRYHWLARRDGHGAAWAKGVVVGRVHGTAERWTYRRWRLNPDACERLFRWEQVRRHMQELAKTGVNRIVLAGLGKNCYPFVRGAAMAGIAVEAIGDDRFCAPGRRYRGVPIVTEGEALSCKPDAFVTANTGTVHARRIAARWVGQTVVPVHCWFGAAQTTASNRPESQSRPDSTDEYSEAPVGVAGN